MLLIVRVLMSSLFLFVGYGEIKPWMAMEPGKRVKRGDCIGYVTPVLRPEKFRPYVVPEAGWLGDRLKQLAERERG